MNKSVLLKAAGIVLGAVALVVVIVLLRGGDGEPDEGRSAAASAGSGSQQSPTRGAAAGGTGGDATTDPGDGEIAALSGRTGLTPGAADTPTGIAADDLPDPFEEEGKEQLQAYMDVYRKVTDPEEKSSLLIRVRKLEIEDDPDVNKLLLHEAFSDNEDIRDSARIGIFNYGGERMRAQLEEMLVARPDAPEKDELENLLDDLALPPFNRARRSAASAPPSE